jgi:hypothetical protein
MRFLGNFLRWVSILVWILLIFFWYEMRGHSEVSKPPKLVPDIFHYTNPRMYQLGHVVDLDLIKISGKTWTVLTWKPAYAPLLYSESLLFCGPKASELFVNLTSEDEIVIIYSRAIEVARAESPPSILACHTLEKVIKVQSPKEQN